MRVFPSHDQFWPSFPLAGIIMLLFRELYTPAAAAPAASKYFLFSRSL